MCTFQLRIERGSPTRSVIACFIRPASTFVIYVCTAKTTQYFRGLRIPLTTIFKVLPAKQPRITSLPICRKNLESHHLRGTEIALQFLTRSIINCSVAIGSYIKTKWNYTCFLNACIFQRNRTDLKKIQLHYPLNCWLTPLRLDNDSA